MNQIHGEVDYGIPIDMNEASKNVNLVIIGHVDSGKSTLTGHLLEKLGIIGSHQIKKNEKLTE